jgi:hypothetical protein
MVVRESGVAIAIMVEVGAFIARIPEAVEIDVDLVGIGNRRAVVQWADVVWISGIPGAVTIEVSAGIALIAEGVSIGIPLAWIWHGTAIVAGVADPISVSVNLFRVGNEWARVDWAGVGRVSRIAEPIMVRIGAWVLIVEQPVAVDVWVWALVVENEATEFVHRLRVLQEIDA